MSPRRFLLTYLIEGDSYTWKQRSKRYFVHFSNFVSMLLENEENAAFFTLFDDLAINIPSAIKVWTSDRLSVLTLTFKKWKTVDFLLSLKDPFRWVKHGGSGSRRYWKTILRSTNDRSAVTYQINLSFLSHYLLLLLDLSSFFKKAFYCKFWNICFVTASSNLCGLFWHSSINLSLINPF